MGNRLQGQVALVTGAGRGIGRGVALLLAEEGAAVVVNDAGVNLDGTGHDEGPAAQVVNEIKAKGGRAVAVTDSVADFEGARRMVQAALDNFGRLDILCHVAGILRDRMVFNMTPEEWDAVLAVHLKGAFNTVRNAVEPMMRQRHGRILLFSSGSGLGSSGQANYSAAKEGMVGFARALARDLGPYGINVNAIYPGGATRMTASVPASARERRAAAGIVGGGQMAGRADMAPNAPPPPPAGDEGGPRDPLNNAPTVVFLCTDAASNISGQVIGTSGWQASRYSPRHVIRSISKPDRWTVAELEGIIPGALTAGIPNPAPAQQPQPQAQAQSQPAGS
jgi:NAD(P)-dependent dehydrogenase (short-subunit alcohol dehydrogenase family)